MLTQERMYPVHIVTIPHETRNRTEDEFGDKIRNNVTHDRRSAENTVREKSFT